MLEALKGFCGDKVPEPDGFTMAFWQFAWDFVKDEGHGVFLGSFMTIVGLLKV